MAEDMGKTKDPALRAGKGTQGRAPHEGGIDYGWLLVAAGVVSMVPVAAWHLASAGGSGEGLGLGASWQWWRSQAVQAYHEALQAWHAARAGEWIEAIWGAAAAGGMGAAGWACYRIMHAGARGEAWRLCLGTVAGVGLATATAWWIQ